MVKLLAHAVDDAGNAFFQVFVCSAANEADARSQVERYLKTCSATLLEVDEEETARVVATEVPNELRSNGNPTAGIVGASGRIFYPPEVDA